MPISFVEFFITDGTTFIDLQRNFKLAQYQPGTLTYKDGGVFQSGLGDGRRLVQRYYDNVTDQLTLVVKAGCQSNAIADLRKLRQLLEKAADYWTAGWSNEFVYLISRASGDNAARYATVYAGMAPNDPDPFAHPFTGPLSSTGIIQVNFEHSPWQDVVPGTGTALPVSVYLKSSTSSAPVSPATAFGNTDDTGVREEVTNGTAYVTFSDANYTDYDAITPDVDAPTSTFYSQIWWVFGGSSAAGGFNVQEFIGYPRDLSSDLSAGPFLDTGIYFGSDAPFSNIVFDIERANGNLTFGDWEYWDGAAWTALADVVDETNAFANTGVLSVSWTLPDDWAQSTEFAEGPHFWVRKKITNSGGPASVPPRQDNRLIYTASSPYVEILADNIGGDVPALVSIQLASERRTNILYNSMMIAARSFDRGWYFSPYIGFSSSASQGVLTLSGLQSSSFLANSESPYGEYLEFRTVANAVGSETVDINLINASGAIRRDAWQGKFRAFLRVYQSGGALGDFLACMQLISDNSTVVYSGPFVAPARVNHKWLVMDMGLIDLDPKYDYNIRVLLEKLVADGTYLYIYDLILMPVDEWVGEISFPTIDPGRSFTPTTAAAAIFLADPLTYPIDDTWAAVDPDYQAPFNPIPAQYSSSSPPVLQKSERQRLWFFGYNRDTSGIVTAKPWEMFGVTVKIANRYQHLKGAQA